VEISDSVQDDVIESSSDIEVSGEVVRGVEGGEREECEVVKPKHDFNFDF
jgi:hypothetical protein